MIVALIMVSIPSLFVLRKVIGVWFKKRLEEDTMRRRKHIEEMRKELKKPKIPREQKTLNNFREEEEMTEEELTEAQIQDSDEELEEDG